MCLYHFSPTRTISSRISCIKRAPPMGHLPDTQNRRCACAGNAGNDFPVTAGKRSRHASRHVRHARAVVHAGIANYQFSLKLAAGENVPGIPNACSTCNFTYLVRGPCQAEWHRAWDCLSSIINRNIQIKSQIENFICNVKQLAAWHLYIPTIADI